MHSHFHAIFTDQATEAVCMVFLYGARICILFLPCCVGIWYETATGYSCIQNKRFVAIPRYIRFVFVSVRLSCSRVDIIYLASSLTVDTVAARWYVPLYAPYTMNTCHTCYLPVQLHCVVSVTQYICIALYLSVDLRCVIYSFLHCSCQYI